MKSLILAATIAALGLTEAHAALQLAFDVGGTPFFCADNTGCDQNPTLGILQIGDQIVNGVIINGSIQASSHASVAFLSTSSLSVINTNAAAVSVEAAIGDTGFFSTPSVVVGISGAGTWESALGSSISLGWFVDPANTQGANFATDAPGTQVGSFLNSPTLLVDSFSDTNTLNFATASPFSMTLTTSGTLSAGAALINRGQNIAAAAIPEPATWALMALGFIGLMGAGRRRLRQQV